MRGGFSKPEEGIKIVGTGLEKGFYDFQLIKYRENSQITHLAILTLKIVFFMLILHPDVETSILNYF